MSARAWLLAALVAALAAGGAAAAWWLPLRPLGWPAVRALVRTRFPDVPRISTAALAAWLADPARPAPLLLDARTPAEFRTSHLRGARRVLAGDDLPAVLADVPRDRPVVTYCAVGWRSAELARALRAEGWTNVRNLEGSIFAWANEGRPLVRDGEPTDVVHPYDRRWGALLEPERRAPMD